MQTTMHFTSGYILHFNTKKTMSFRFFPSFHTESFHKTKLKEREQIDLSKVLSNYLKANYKFNAESQRTQRKTNTLLKNKKFFALSAP
jgi:hypothetical protein